VEALGLSEVLRRSAAALSCIHSGLLAAEQQAAALAQSQAQAQAQAAGAGAGAGGAAAEGSSRPCPAADLLPVLQRLLSAAAEASELASEAQAAKLLQLTAASEQLLLRSQPLQPLQPLLQAPLSSAARAGAEAAAAGEEGSSAAGGGQLGSAQAAVELLESAAAEARAASEQSGALLLLLLQGTLQLPALPLHRRAATTLLLAAAFLLTLAAALWAKALLSAAWLPGAGRA
jgi:hypothetical protein